MDNNTNFYCSPQNGNNMRMSNQLPPQTALNQFMSQNGFKGRYVTSFEEVKASQIDFDGSVFYFPDTTQTRIYTKQMNLDGSVSYNTFEIVRNPSNSFDNNNQIRAEDKFITKLEFNNMVTALKNKFAKLESSLTASNSIEEPVQEQQQQKEETIDFNF